MGVPTRGRALAPSSAGPSPSSGWRLSGARRHRRARGRGPWPPSSASPGLRICCPLSRRPRAARLRPARRPAVLPRRGLPRLQQGRPAAARQFRRVTLGSAPAGRRRRLPGAAGRGGAARGCRRPKACPLPARA
ncbi:hypothetical protein LV779_08990 [Streptomyces thinghirensis]|nr:hypothetical protein [Streptomyces thinghirensis]